MTKMYSRYTSLLCLLFSYCFSNCVQAQDRAYEQPIEISFCEDEIGAINFSRDQVKINLQGDFKGIDKLSANNLMRNICYNNVKRHIFSSILNKTQQDDAYIDSLISCILTLQESYDIYKNEILNQYSIRKLSSVKSKQQYAEATFLSSIEVQYLLSLEENPELQYLLSLQKNTELQKRFYLNTDEYYKSHNGSIVQLAQDLSQTKMYIDNILSDAPLLRNEIKKLEISVNADFDELRNLAFKQKDTVIKSFRDITFETIKVDELLQQLRENNRHRSAAYDQLQKQIIKKDNENSIINSINEIEHDQEQHRKLSLNYQKESIQIPLIDGHNVVINSYKALLDTVIVNTYISEKIKDRIKALSYYEYGLQTQS
ncbi:MAG: hypothetical protein IJ481_01895 [Alphaproteobacteria bacterium]|nr:hypothetical protein [Alphaproteobacteria bacterium]